VRSVRTRRPRCRRIIHETDASMGAASRCPGFSSTQRMSLSGLRTSSFSPKSRRVLCLWNSSHRSLRLGSHFARIGPTRPKHRARDCAPQSIRPKRARDTQDAALGGLSHERPAIRSAASYRSPSTAGGRRFQGAKGCLNPCSSPVRAGSEDRTTCHPTPGHPPA